MREKPGVRTGPSEDVQPYDEEHKKSMEDTTGTATRRTVVVFRGPPFSTHLDTAQIIKDMLKQAPKYTNKPRLSFLIVYYFHA